MLRNILTTILLLVVMLQAHGSENPSKVLMGGDSVPIHYWADALGKTFGQSQKPVTFQPRCYRGRCIFILLKRPATVTPPSEINTERRLLWDEDNRLLALSENGYVSSYWYDADGERTIKMHGASSAAYVNGTLVNGQTDHDKYTIYVNPYFTLADDSRYMKHVYMGGERIATETDTLSPQFGQFQNGDVACGGLNLSTLDYAAKYDAQQQAYQARYDSLGIHLNSHEPAISKNAGYVQTGILPESIEEQGTVSISEEAIGEETAQEEIIQEQDDTNEEIFDENENLLEDNIADWIEESVSEESWETADASDVSTSDIANGNSTLKLLAFGSSKICESTYYYHKDHLGSSSLITDERGNIVQQLEYLPYGEVFLDKQSDNWTTSYKFNGKELDEETGLYYYGARYYDPRLSIWYGTDPMQEKYPELSTYSYCLGNPIKLIDPDGKEILDMLPVNNKNQEISKHNFFNKWHDKKTSIILMGHGGNNGKTFYTPNAPITKSISANDLYGMAYFLEDNSKTWNISSIASDNIQIVLFSCETGSYDGLAERLSKQDKFQNISIFAPSETININPDGSVFIDNNGVWREYLNGNVVNEYSGNTVPGTQEFDSSTTWEKQTHNINWQK